VADNDLALGQIVEAVSQSRFWEETVIIVVQDDPQAGFDHVDGRRTVAMVISPYTKRGEVISTHYNQNSILRTIPLDEMNPAVASLSGTQRYYAEQSMMMPLDDIDQADEDLFNRVIWHSVKGYDVPYPVTEPDEDEGQRR